MCKTTKLPSSRVICSDSMFGTVSMLRTFSLACSLFWTPLNWLSYLTLHSSVCVHTLLTWISSYVLHTHTHTHTTATSYTAFPFGNVWECLGVLLFLGASWTKLRTLCSLFLLSVFLTKIKLKRSVFFPWPWSYQPKARHLVFCLFLKASAALHTAQKCGAPCSRDTWEGAQTQKCRSVVVVLIYWSISCVRVQKASPDLYTIIPR